MSSLQRQAISGRARHIDGGMNGAVVAGGSASYRLASRSIVAYFILLHHNQHNAMQGAQVTEMVSVGSVTENANPAQYSYSMI
jgi:hypothetical protein